jgi:hypothetical protein
LARGKSLKLEEISPASRIANEMTARNPMNEEKSKMNYY